MLVIPPAGRRHRRRDADAEQSAAASRGFPPLRDPVIVRQRQRVAEVLREIAAVVGLPHRRLVRHRARRDRVAAAQFGRVDAQFAGRLVDDAFDDVDRFGPAAAAIGRRRHRVGQHRRDLGVHRLERIGVDETPHADRQRYGRPVGRIIGADRRHPARAQREEFVRPARAPVPPRRRCRAPARRFAVPRRARRSSAPDGPRPPRPTATARIRGSSRLSCQSRRPSCRTRRAADGAARGKSARPAPPGSGAPTAPCSGSCSGLRRGRIARDSRAAPCCSRSPG